MSRLDKIKARTEQVQHWTSTTSIEQAMARLASSAADVPWLLAEVERLTAERDALQVGRDRDRVKGATAVLNEELRTSEQEARARRAEAEVERLTAELAEVKRTYTPCDLDLLTERDALAAQVAEGTHLADVWASDLATDAMVNVMDGAALEVINEQMERLLELRDALAGSDADTGAEEAGHRCEPYYSRSECGQCGWQEQWCATCSRQMCGCATDAMGADQ